MKSYTDKQKRYIRIGYYRRNKNGMSEDLFESLSEAELNSLMESGKRKLTIQDRFRDNIGGFVIVVVVLVAIAYTVITLQIMTADYNRITKVEACDLLQNLEVPTDILPSQTVSIEKTDNALGAASDCWVRVKSADTEIVAVAYVSTGYKKQYPQTNSAPGDWRGIDAQEFSFEDNFYTGNVTTYKTEPIESELTNDMVIAERRLSNAVGEQMIDNLPKNEQIDEVRRGFVWGWLLPTFFMSEVQGSLPDAPEDK